MSAFKTPIKRTFSDFADLVSDFHSATDSMKGSVIGSPFAKLIVHKVKAGMSTKNKKGPATESKLELIIVYGT